MTRQILFLITSDPRVSAKPAEAVRIAAGIAVGMRIRVAVCFHDAAVAALSTEAAELIDGENFARYLPLVGEAGVEGLVVNKTSNRVGLQVETFRTREISDEELAEVALASDCVVRF